MSTPCVTVLDVSGHNAAAKANPIGFARAVKAAGHHGVIVKCTEGEGYTFGRFVAIVDALRTEGLSAGAYHFAEPDTDAGDVRRELDRFLAGITGVPLDLPPWLDVEATTLRKGLTGAWCVEWLRGYQERTGGLPWWYSYRPFALAHIGSALSAWPLVLAAYPVHKPAEDEWPAPVAGVTPVGWQYANKLILPGFDGRYDCTRIRALASR